MIFTVFLKDGSNYPYDYEKYDWYFGEKYFHVKKEENGLVVLLCPLEQIDKIVVEGNEL